MPERMVWRHPFPGPRLAIRIIGDVTRERSRSCARPTRSCSRRCGAPGSTARLWQCFAVLPAIRSVSVMGDERTYEYPIVIRAVTSEAR